MRQLVHEAIEDLEGAGGYVSYVLHSLNGVIYNWFFSRIMQGLRLEYLGILRGLAWGVDRHPWLLNLHNVSEGPDSK